MKNYIYVGFLFICSNTYGQNKSVADSLVRLLEYSNDISDSLKLVVLYNISVNHTDLELKLFYSNQLIFFAKDLDEKIWMQRGLLEQGHVYKKKGDLENAIKSYIRSAEICKSINYHKGVASVYSAIGSAYRVQENYPTALIYYNLGIDELRRLNDSTNLAVSLMNTGELYRINHLLDTALLYFKESGEIFDLRNYKIGKAYNLGNIGLVYAERGKHQIAERNLTKATAILHELGDNYPISVYHIYMADIYKDKGDLVRALEYAHTSYSLAIANGFKEQVRDASLKLSELYDTTQDYKKAYEYQKQYLTYRDSINSEETIRKMADLRTEYEVSQKQIEVDLLHQKHKTNRIVGAGLLGIILLIGAMAFVLHKRNIEKRQANKLLTEQKQQLQIQHQELDILNTTKDRFFSIISHDLRGPVNSFKGLVTLMKMSVEDKNYEELPKMTGLLDRAASQLSMLLENLLDWAINQQGEFPYSPEKTQIKTLVEDVLNTSKVLAESKNIVISANIGKNIFVWADKNSVKTIFRNLLNNALKFTHKNGEINITATASDKYIELNLKDNGVGIPKERFDSLFSLNELKSTPGTEGEKGLGLGLKLAYDFAKMNKGVITAKSEEGVGATFSVRLPTFKN